MYALFTMYMNTRTCIVDIVLIVRYQIDASMAYSQCMKTFQFSLKLCLFHDKIVDSASNVLSALKLEFICLSILHSRAVCLPSSYGQQLLSIYLYCCNHTDIVGNPTTSMAVSMVFQLPKIRHKKNPGQHLYWLMSK